MSVEDPYRRIRAATGCVRHAKGQGTAFLLTERHAITCWHVVEEMRPEDLELVFPWDPRGERFDRAHATKVRRIARAKSMADLAMLELESPPEGSAQRSLATGTLELASTFLSWGHRDIGDGRASCGLPAQGIVVADMEDRGQRTLYLDTSKVDQGMSGAPVVQTSPFRVVGVVTTKLTRESGGIAILLDELAELFPDLSKMEPLHPVATSDPQAKRLMVLPFGRRASPIFVGREEELTALDTAVFASGRVAIHAAIEGLPGVGKTEIALQYVQRYADPIRFPGGIVWLDASTALTSQWPGLAASLGLDVQGKTADEIEREVLSELARRPRLLLVLDNAESWGELEGHLPQANHPLLVTTRKRRFGGNRFDHRELSVLSDEAARALLHALMPERSKRSHADVERLVIGLAGHALALEVAGAYLERYPFVPVETFLERQAGPDFDAGAATEEDVAYRRTFAAVMQEVIERLGTTGSQGSVDLLRLMGLFADAAAPLDLLRAVWTRLGRKEVEGALQPLVDLHLVEADESTWTMHRLVRAQARTLERQLPELEAQEHVLANAVKALEEYALTDFGKLEPHVVEVAGRTRESESVARVLGEASLFLGRLSRYSEAKAWSEEALRIDLAVFGMDSPKVATLRSNLAAILRDLGDLDGARRETEEALRIDLAVSSMDDPSVALRRSNLATILSDLGDLDGARKEVEEALRIDLAVFGKDHPNVATRRLNLATILKDLGDLDGARRETEEALHIDLAARGKDHPYVAIDRSNLAVILKDLGDLDGLLREATEAVRIVRLLPPGASDREAILSLWSRQNLSGL